MSDALAIGDTRSVRHFGGQRHTVPLRRYQEDARDAVLAEHRAGVRRQLLQLPTGTGKTVVFGATAQERIAAGRVLVLAHRDELIQQAVEKLGMMGFRADQLGVVTAARNEIDRPVVIASVQSLAQPKRLAALDFGDIRTLIIDEAHHAAAESYRRVIEAFDDGSPDRLLLGVTATPHRADGKPLHEGDDAIFEKLVFSRNMLEMIPEKFLCDIRARQVWVDANLRKVALRGGDFAAGELAEQLAAANAPEHIVQAWKEHAEGRKTLVFTPTVELAHQVAQAFREAGVPAAGLDGGMAIEDRRALLDSFKSGHISVVANCAVLTEGFDEPSVSCIVIARPTRSWALYVQMIGRGTRPSRATGKTDLVVLDVVGTTSRHDVLNIPKALGLPGGSLDGGESVLEATARAESEAARAADADALRSKVVDLFASSRMAWRPVGDDAHILPTEDGFLAVAGNGEKWGVFRYPKDRTSQPELLFVGTSFEYAAGVAEDHAREHGRHLVARDAAWRKAPPTPKQLALLRKWRCPRLPESKGQASEWIGQRIAQKRLREQPPPLFELEGAG